MDRNGNADVLPPLKSSTKGNVKAHESNVSGALPLVGGVQVQQLFEEETNQQNKGKVANEYKAFHLFIRASILFWECFSSVRKEI